MNVSRCRFLSAVLALAAAPSAFAFGDDAGLAPVADAGPVAGADGGADAGVGVPLVSKSALAAMRARFERLTSADSPAGSPGAGVPLVSLFPFDLTDPSAVERRIEFLEARLDRLQAQYPYLAAIPTSSTSTLGASPTLVYAALEAKTLAHEIAFLRLESTTRGSVLDADAARRMHETEQEEAKLRGAQAAEESARAYSESMRALEDAERAKTEALKAIWQELASVSQLRAELAEHERTLAQRQEASSEAGAEALKRVQQLLERESKIEGPGPSVVALLDAMTAELATAAAVLDRVLSAPDRSSFQRWPISRGRLRGDSEAELEATAELAAAVADFVAAHEAYGQQRRLFRIQSVSAAYRRMNALAEARSRLLQVVDNEARSNRIGWSVGAFEAMRLEFRVLVLSARAEPVVKANVLPRLPSLVKDFLGQGATFWSLVKVVFIIFLALWLRGRGPALGRWFHEQARIRLHSAAAIRRFTFFQRNLTAYGAYLLFLGATHAIQIALGALSRVPLVDLGFTLVLWLAYYWLFSTWLSASVLWIARKRRILFSRQRRAELQASVMLVGRTVLLCGLFQSLAIRIFREGALYNAARLLLAIALLSITAYLIRHWRPTIVRAYLERWPDGPLARLVESTQDRFYNLFIVAWALIYVLVSGVAQLARQFVLEFEQTRKALAFLFRKRLERRSDQLGTWDVELGTLPKTLLAAFSLEALRRPALRLDYFPGIEDFDSGLAQWKAGTHRGSCIVRGDRGYGKSTWLHYALSRERDLPTEYWALERRGPEPEALLGQLGTFLGLEADSAEAIVLALRSGPRRVIAVDDIHRLFYRQLDGGRAFDLFMEIVEATAERVFWLASSDRLAWRHMAVARPVRIRFREVITLADWPEERLRDLLMLRASSSGVIHEFEDLVVSAETEDSEEALAAAGEGYTRLIWDYSDGCPLVALRFWLHSLVPAGTRTVRVRLFKQPETSRLGRIPEEGVFIYAAIATHGELSVAEVSEMVLYDLPICSAVLTRGVEEGYLYCTDEGGRYGLAVDWQRQMIRFLRGRRAL